MNKELLEEFNKRLKLEEEFAKASDEVQLKINRLLSKAEEYLEEAIEIAEEYGTPMYFNITDVGQIYTPFSFKEKWDELREKPSAYNLLENNGLSKTLYEIADLSDFNEEYYYMANEECRYPGWNTSQICY
jgi:hypothetical protein